MAYRILIVDDEPILTELLSTHLQDHGYTVSVANSSDEALAKLAAKPNLILLDINMPGMDGLEVLRRIKSGQPGLKVVMLSALSQESNVRQALQYGADAFVVKPFQPECLLERIG